MDEKKVRGILEDLKMVIGRAKEMDLNRVSRFTNIPIENLEVIVEALEKQLPKKGIKEKITEGVNKGLHKFYCPVCYRNGDLSNKCNVGEYCSDCGQRLDWSE